MAALVVIVGLFGVNDGDWQGRCMMMMVVVMEDEEGGVVFELVEKASLGKGDRL